MASTQHKNQGTSPNSNISEESQQPPQTCYNAEIIVMTCEAPSIPLDSIFIWGIYKNAFPSCSKT